MRVAALAFGLLAGLIASLILALGGLDVAPATTSPDRQMQAVRFGLFVIGNIGFLGAGLALASPLAGAILLVVGAIAWVGAALFLHHTTDLVLITPPVLLLIAAGLAAIAFFRRPAAEPAENEPEILPPLGARARAEAQDAEPPGMTIPAFAAEPQQARASAFRAAPAEDGLRQPKAEEWDPRKRRAPPPRATPAFRDVDEDYEDDDEPSGFSRFALAVSSILSFALYAALAGAALLVMWNARQADTGRPAASAATAEIAAPAMSSKPSTATSSEPVLAPVLTATPKPPASAPAAPVLLAPAAGTASSQASSEESFGDVLVSADPDAPPRLTQDGSAVASPEPTAKPPVLPADEPAVATADIPATLTPEDTAQATPPGALVLPFTMTANMAAQRAGGRPAPPRAEPAAPASNTTGL